MNLETVFSDAFLDAIAKRTADIVLAKLNRPAVEKRYMSIDEAAVYSGYSTEALWKHIQRGHLPTSRQGKSVRVDKQEIDRWMTRNRQ
jgi:excisionase family DNA binding protein